MTPFNEKMLETGEMLKMLKFKGHTHKKLFPTGGMLKKNVKNDKIFLGLTPPPQKKDKTPKNASHWGNVKNVKNPKGLLTKNA